MRTVILMRHAKAEPAEGGMADIDRHLTPRGLADAPKVASALVSAGLGVDLALVSNAQRTQETWFSVAPMFGSPAARILPELYSANDEGIWRLLMEETEANRLMVVGHNPFMHDLAQRILRASSDPAAKKVRRELNHLPTSGSIAFSFPDGPLKISAAEYIGFWEP